MSVFGKNPYRYPILRSIQPSQDVKVFDKNGDFVRNEPPKSFAELLKLEGQKRKADALNKKNKT